MCTTSKGVNHIVIFVIIIVIGGVLDEVNFESGKPGFGVGVVVVVVIVVVGIVIVIAGAPAIGSVGGCCDCRRSSDISILV